MPRALLIPVAALSAGILLLASPSMAQQFGPLTDRDFLYDSNPDPDQVELGRLLFFDKVLSGNRNISCATCHHPLFGTGDGLSLPLGEGGRGIGVDRDTGAGSSRVRARVPRNAPPLFNLGARQFRRLFHDGRVEIDPTAPSGFRTPAGDTLPAGLRDVLAAQAMFPVTSATEMAGDSSENEIAAAAAIGRLAGSDGVWELLAARLRGIPEYVTLFSDAFADVRTAADVTMVHAANAIAAYEIAAYRSDQSQFDRFLRGETGALSVQARRGMGLFYGPARCSRCHQGVLQTDQRFHAIGMPQIGPGTGDGPDGRDDYGREKVTGDPDDRFEFRTPSLRNVALTGPWGHDGAYGSLEAIVRHYDNPRRSLEQYDRSQAVLPAGRGLNGNFRVMNDPERVEAIADAIDSRPVRLGPPQVADLVAFLQALTDPRARDLSSEIPARVPSGLSVE